MLTKNFKKIFLLIFTLLVMTPNLVLASGGFIGSDIPDLNPLCWSKHDCNKQHGSFVRMHSGPCRTANFGTPEDDDWGQCLPAGAVETEVGIGGVKKFNTVGNYILTVYNYSLKIAGIIGVAVIMVAGVQWLTSGGNRETITRAHKRIFGAIIGLIIAYASYFILANVNPALVNLRLPQVWMIKPSKIIPQFCSDLSDPKTKLSLAAEYDNQNKEVKLTGKESKKDKFDNPFSQEQLWKYISSKDYSKALTSYHCGRRFFPAGGNGATCMSDYCLSGTICSAFGNTASQNYICIPSLIAGDIKYSGNKTANTDWDDNSPVYRNDVYLWALCKAGEMLKVKGQGKTYVSNNKESYTFSAVKNGITEATSWCNKNGVGLAGFVLELQMDEKNDPTNESHFIGKDSSGKSKDLGDDGFFLRNTLDREVAAAMSAKREYSFYSWNTGIKESFLISPSQLGKGSYLKPFLINADEIYDVDLFTTAEDIRAKFYATKDLLTEQAFKLWNGAACNSLDDAYYSCYTEHFYNY